MNKEPATIVSSLIGLITAVLGLAAAFGLNISDEQQNAIIGVVIPASAFIALIGPIIRQFVTPTKKAEKAIEDAYTATPGVHKKPTL